MDRLILRYSVSRLDGTELFAAGTKLSEDAIQEAGRRQPAPTQDYSFLLKHGSVFNDMLDMMSQPPYSSIYANSTDRDAVLALMKNSRVQQIVLESLDYFRRKDFYTYRHALMVFALSTLLARHLAVPGLDLGQEIISAGPTHDIGKICIPLPILTKSTALTVSERRYLEHHPAAGCALLAWSGGDMHGTAARIARNHHERNDGSGYPVGIQLHDMLVEIIAACDIYDALVSPRPYRATSFENRTALEELTELARRNCLNSTVVQSLVALNRRSRPSAQTCVVSLERRGTPPADNLYGVTEPDPAAPEPHTA